MGANTNLLGRLASVVEPNGNVVLAYDDFGRPRATGRTIAGKTVTELLTMGMSGQVQRVLYGHDFTVDMAYDSIGRPASITGAGTILWQADSYDGAGRLLTETFGNGVQQLTERDVLGLASRVQVNRPIMAGPLYDVSVLRNAWTGITSATDIDGVGLNHSATFTYDGAARLTDTTIGTGAEMYSFGYEYDGLQNMTLRTQLTPIGAATLDMVTGNYKYGESGAGPRQLTSVLDDQDALVANFTYDDAGRMTEDTGKLLTYNGLDQLVHVELPGETIPLVYSYGYNGQRTYTQHADGTEEYNFTESIRQEDDLRHHYLKIGSRTVARVTMRDLEASNSATVPTAPLTRPPTGPAVPTRWLLLALAFALALLGLTRWRRRALPMRAGPRCGEPSDVRVWAGPSYVRGLALAPLALLLFANLSCSFMLGSNYQATWTTQEIIYFHQGFSAGPTMMTDSGGNIFSERRYEPFGVDIDTYAGPAGGIGPSSSGIDFRSEPTNILNKQSDPDTKWSYHGARWVSPQTARWHTPDPIVKAPDGKFMAEPWALHPYQYVKQNPIIYWDPDGREDINLTLHSLDVMNGVENPHPLPYGSGGDTAFLVASVVFHVAVAIVIPDQEEQAWIMNSSGYAAGFGDEAFSYAVVKAAGLWRNIKRGVRGARAGMRVAKAVRKADWAKLRNSTKSLNSTYSRVAKFIKRGGCRCLEAGTLVQTTSGDIRIEHVEAGDMVACSDTKTGEWDWCEVLEPFSKINDERLVQVETANDSLVSSESHPYWVVSGTGLTSRPAVSTLDGDQQRLGWDGGRWVMARDLLVGDTLRSADGATRPVLRTTIRSLKESAVPVFNLVVADNHNFVVGLDGVLVHNCYGRYMQRVLGIPKPKGMINPHAHHIVMKGKFSRWNWKARRMVASSRQMLRNVGIDPMWGAENLVWAPNAGHSIANAEHVYNTLKNAPQNYRGITKTLKELGNKAAQPK